MLDAIDVLVARDLGFGESVYFSALAFIFSCSVFLFFFLRNLEIMGGGKEKTYP